MKKEIQAFIVAEFFTSKGFSPYFLDDKIVIFEKIVDEKSIKHRFERSLFNLPIDEVNSMLNISHFTMNDFKIFEETLTTSEEFEQAIAMSVIKTKLD
jgi:hypothetical protein